MADKALWLCAVCANKLEPMLELQAEPGTIRRAVCDNCRKKYMVVRYVRPGKEDKPCNP